MSASGPGAPAPNPMNLREFTNPLYEGTQGNITEMKNPLSEGGQLEAPVSGEVRETNGEAHKTSEIKEGKGVLGSVTRRMTEARKTVSEGVSTITKGFTFKAVPQFGSRMLTSLGSKLETGACVLRDGSISVKNSLFHTGQQLDKAEKKFESQKQEFYRLKGDLDRDYRLLTESIRQFSDAEMLGDTKRMSLEMNNIKSLNNSASKLEAKIEKSYKEFQKTAGELKELLGREATPEAKRRVGGLSEEVNLLTKSKSNLNNPLNQVGNQDVKNMMTATFSEEVARTRAKTTTDLKPEQKFGKLQSGYQDSLSKFYLAHQELNQAITQFRNDPTPQNYENMEKKVNLKHKAERNLLDDYSKLEQFSSDNKDNEKVQRDIQFVRSDHQKAGEARNQYEEGYARVDLSMMLLEGAKGAIEMVQAKG